MVVLLNWYKTLSLLDKIGFWGSILTILTFTYSIIKCVVKLRIQLSKKIIREFLFVYKDYYHYIFTGITIIAILFYIIQSNDNLMYKIITSFGYIALIFMIFSFFIKQNRPIRRQMILVHIEEAIKNNSDYVSAIKFDVDLIVAINDYSYAVGSGIVNILNNVLSKYLKQLKKCGTTIVSIDIPESDEVIWILPQTPVNRAADIADEIRREVKMKIKDIPYYSEACDYVISSLVNPPLNEEEKEGIGTISAGVAAYNRGVEALLSDISSATKEAKFRGRNRTIIYQRGKQAIVRNH